jgi:plastocyanin
VNSLIFTRVMKSIKALIAFSFLYSIPAAADWNVDFSRRSDQMRSKVMLPSERSENQEEKGVFDKIFETSVPMQEIVIINTEQGFVPSTVRVREGAQYRLVIVNVNEKAKNVSFVLDSFSEHHATFYGKMKSFHISPKKEGVYTFVSPETSAQGRLVVHPALGKPEAQMGGEVRAPASE